MTDDIMKLLRGGVKVLTGGDSPQAQATGCNSLTDGIVRMGEVVYHAIICDIRIQDASEINFEAFLCPNSKETLYQTSSVTPTAKQGGIYRETCNVFRIGVCVVQHQIPVAVYVPVFSGYPDFGASRAYRRVFDGTDFGLSCYHYKMFAEIPSFFNVFRG